MLAAGVVFLTVLGMLVLKNKYRVPSAIQLSGNYEKPELIHYAWDSGSGFNEDEESLAWLGRYEDFERTVHRLRISLASAAAEAPPAGRIRVRGIFLDARPGEGAGRQYVSVLGGGRDVEPGRPVEMEALFGRLTLVLEKGVPPAELAVHVDGHIFPVRLGQGRATRIVQIRRFLPGAAVNRLDLPQLGLRGVRIEIPETEGKGPVSGLEYCASGPPVALAPTEPGGFEGTIDLDGQILQNSRFHGMLFAVQIVLALLAGWACFALFSAAARSPGGSLGATLTRAFRDGKHRAFWGFFLVSFAVYAAWLLGKWPGELNWDSFVMWRQTETLQLTHNHSFVYVLLLLLVKQVVDSPAGMVLLQAAFMSLLLAWIYAFALENGARKGWLLAFFGLTVASVPIAMTVIFVNTCSLFALLVSFWSFFLFRSGYLRSLGRPLSYSNTGLLALAVMFYALVAVRHHGLAYVLILPVMAWVLKTFRAPDFKKFLAYFALVFVGIHIVLAGALGIHGRTAYGPRLNALINPGVHPFNPPHGETGGEEDASVSGPDVRRGDDPTPADEERRHRVGTALNDLPRFLADKTYMFTEALGLSGGMAPYFQREREVGAIKMSRPLSARRLISRPILPELAERQQDLLRATSSFESLLKPRLLFWNTGIPLLLLALVFAWRGRLPHSAAASFFVLSQVLLLFPVLPAGCWRFLSFVYVFGFLVLPMAALELRRRAGGGQARIEPDRKDP
jgi:hypothetical protein